MASRLTRFLGLSLMGLGLCEAASSAATNSVQPYIDHLREQMKKNEPPAEEGVVDPYIESIRKSLKPKTSKSYIDELKEANPSLKEAPSEESYTEKVKAGLAPDPDEKRSAIQDVLNGKTELKAKKKGMDKITQAYGLRYGLFPARAVTAPSNIQARSFGDVYGANYSADFSMYAEYQTFHSDWFGSLGIFALGGVGYNSGKGVFSDPIPNPGTGTNFSSTSDVKFQFFTLPFVAGLNYRLNLMRVIKPYIMAGPSLISFAELRNDQNPGYLGASVGAFFAVGTAINLDWVGEAWDLYSSFGVKHYALTVDYSVLTTLFGDVNISVSGITVGLVFEM